MNGAFRQALIDLIILPQEEVEDENLRCVFDPENRPLPTYGGELDLIDVTSRPLADSYEIGGGVALEHEFDLMLLVQHGDIVEGMQRRDAIATQIALRILANTVALDQVSDPDTNQYVTKVTWLIVWTPIVSNDTNQVARFVITFETQLDA